LAQGNSAPRYLLICGHGDADKGFYFGEYAPFIDTSVLRDKHMPPEVIAPIVSLPGCTVISSACSAEVEKMGKAFTGSGKAAAYIACRTDPDGTAMLVFLVNFFYHLLGKKLSEHEA
jgi:hypothetical protein